MITQTEFIRKYCESSGIVEDGISEERLNRLGLFAIACDCGDEECSGWAMVSRKNLKNHVDLYIKGT